MSGVQEARATTIRPAQQDDMEAVLSLLNEVQGDTEDLSADQFLVAEAGSQVVGCGRLKPTGDILEVASIAVAESYRKAQVGSAIVTALVRSATPPVFLVCATHNIPFFQRFDFAEVSLDEAPTALSNKYAFCHSVEGTAHVMRWG